MALWSGVTPLLITNRGSHGYVLTSVGVIAVIFGLRALRRNRAAASIGVFVLSVAGIGTGVIGAVAMLALTAGTGPMTAAGSLGLPGLQPGVRSTQVQLTSLTTAAGGGEAVVGNGGSVRLGAGYSVRSVVSRPQVHVRLERRTAGGAWSPTGVTASIPEGAALSVVTPPYSTSAATASVQYRLASADSTSASVSVTYENQRFYTGMAATIYAYAAPYCPTTAVRVAALRGREAGEYSPGASLILVDTKVGVTTNLEPATQRSVAVHECSHELQWLNYGSTPAGHDRMAAAAAAHFSVGSNGAPAIEHAADCGAMAVEPNGYLGYGGYCTAAELRTAARLLRGGQY